MRSPEIVESLPFDGQATVKEGSSVQMSCAAIGNPQPMIKWKRADGKRMKFRGRNGGVQHSMILEFVQKLDSSASHKLQYTKAIFRKFHSEMLKILF